jgi:hypothetical protein
VDEKCVVSVLLVTCVSAACEGAASDAHGFEQPGAEPAFVGLGGESSRTVYRTSIYPNFASAAPMH